ncbi:hypothetical protein KY285_005381 [Solanum tuberosum]|nr:hypothetical protein KY284_005592 [Solanum tuberosum]KAH0752233.1 hypothetical protein KY285_005381 [Solanum tuberosum]
MKGRITSNTSLVKVKDNDHQEYKVSLRALIWNIRCHFYFVGMVEPFEEKHELDDYRRKLGMQQAIANVNGKIWAFIDEVVKYTICMLNALKVKGFNYGNPWKQ